MALQVQVVYWVNETAYTLARSGRMVGGLMPPLCSQYQQLKKELEKQFPGKLEISGEGTPQVTGWFEVTIAGKLVHSKMNGDGFVDNGIKLSKIVAAIKEALALG